MITFAAIVPHPPMLLPKVGKDNVKKAKVTVAAMKTIEQDLYLSHPDTIVVVSPHGPVMPDAFMINLAANYSAGFKDFGDFETVKTWTADFMLIDRIQRNARKETPLVLGSEENLDYGAGIPLVLLTEHLPKVTVIPVVTSGLDLKAHYDFGKLLKDELMASNKRVAVVASADLSHTLTKDAPAGFAKEGAELDKTIQDLLTTKNAAGLIGTDTKLREAAHECGLRPILTLLGTLDGVNYDPKIISYEFPFGVGYLVSNLVLS